MADFQICWGAETGGLEEVDSVTSGSVTAASVPDGGSEYSFYIPSSGNIQFDAGNAENLDTYPDGGEDFLHIGFALRVPTLATGTFFYACSGSNSTYQFYLSLVSTGALSIHPYLGSTTTSAGGVITAGQWHYIEIIVNRNGGSPTEGAKVYVDGTEVIDAMDGVDSWVYNSAQTLYFTGSAFAFYFDDVYLAVQDTALPDPYEQIVVKAYRSGNTSSDPDYDVSGTGTLNTGTYDDTQEIPWSETNYTQWDDAGVGAIYADDSTYGGPASDPDGPTAILAATAIISAQEELGQPRTHYMTAGNDTPSFLTPLSISLITNSYLEFLIAIDATYLDLDHDLGVGWGQNSSGGRLIDVADATIMAAVVYGSAANGYPLDGSGETVGAAKGSGTLTKDSLLDGAAETVGVATGTGTLTYGVAQATLDGEGETVGVAVGSGTMLRDLKVIGDAETVGVAKGDGTLTKDSLLDGTAETIGVAVGSGTLKRGLALNGGAETASLATESGTLLRGLVLGGSEETAGVATQEGTLEYAEAPENPILTGYGKVVNADKGDGTLTKDSLLDGAGETIGVAVGSGTLLRQYALNGGGQAVGAVAGNATMLRDLKLGGSAETVGVATSDGTLTYTPIGAAETLSGEGETVGVAVGSGSMLRSLKVTGDAETVGVAVGTGTMKLGRRLDGGAETVGVAKGSATMLRELTLGGYGETAGANVADGTLKHGYIIHGGAETAQLAKGSATLTVYRTLIGIDQGIGVARGRGTFDYDFLSAWTDVVVTSDTWTAMSTSKDWTDADASDEIWTDAPDPENGSN